MDLIVHLREILIKINFDTKLHLIIAATEGWYIVHIMFNNIMETVLTTSPKSNLHKSYKKVSSAELKKCLHRLKFGKGLASCTYWIHFSRHSCLTFLSRFHKYIHYNQDTHYLEISYDLSESHFEIRSTNVYKQNQ